MGDIDPKRCRVYPCRAWQGGHGQPDTVSTGRSSQRNSLPVQMIRLPTFQWHHRSSPTACSAPSALRTSHDPSHPFAPVPHHKPAVPASGALPAFGLASLSTTLRSSSSSAHSRLRSSAPRLPPASRMPAWAQIPCTSPSTDPALLAGSLRSVDGCSASRAAATPNRWLPAPDTSAIAASPAAH
jgi:hypothetical protein